jgi:hypothetical protein
MTSADVRREACGGVMMQRGGAEVELIPRNGLSPICPISLRDVVDRRHGGTSSNQEKEYR